MITKTECRDKGIFWFLVFFLEYYFFLFKMREIIVCLLAGGNNPVEGENLMVPESEGIITELFVTATNDEQPKMSIKRRIDK